LIVTLRGRPVESYVRIVGTKGALHADFVIGTVRNFIGPGSSKASLVFNRYIEAKQILFTTTQALLERLMKRRKSYPGLPELIRTFYRSIVNNTHEPLTAFSILETVRLCEIVGKELRKEESKHETRAEVELRKEERKLPPADTKKGWVLVTGGTGFLGRRIATELRCKGFPVRVVARCIPSPSRKVAGVQYYEADLTQGISEDIMKRVFVVVHAAAETSGDKEAHRRNTVLTTRYILRAAAESGVKKFIHISSIAVLKSSPDLEEPLIENTPIDLDESRGPYVWGKAQSERMALQFGEQLGIMVRIIRPGPLLDYNSYEPPGRLGKEIGNFFLAVGSKNQKLNICDIDTAATVIRSYVEDFESKPPILNLADPNSPTRSELLGFLRFFSPF
jgi:nucleoside-diphosphate-sugar epimerase